MLKVYNTLSARKEEFRPAGSPVQMYVCGMTPKFHPHIGHARLFVAMDVVRRYLEYLGYVVRHVQNFTDIDDKIIARAQEEGVTPAEVADKYTRSYFEVMDALNVRRAHVYPSVTAYIPQIIQFIQGLQDKGMAYVVNGDVYFPVALFPDYGKLSKRTEEGGLVGARKELEPGKRDPRDFALWKRAKAGETSWPSPWGDGRPGWHIECSTMSRATLGDQLDIHGGGQDLIFPHHENEIAQSEALTGDVPFVRYWLHAGLVTTAGEKMSHSLYNFTTVQDILQVYEPAALRLYLLGTHYRSPIAYAEENIAAAARGLVRLRTALEGIPELEMGANVLRDGFDPSIVGAPWREFVQRFVEAMDDDFNTAAALGHLFDLAKELNRRRDAGSPQEELMVGRRTLLGLADVLGIELMPARRERREEIAPFVELLLSTRQRLREAKQYTLADSIRDGLRQLGIAVEDRPEGPVWRRI